MKEVLDFIERRFKNTDANWLNGNCYWFAKILVERFPALQIYYIPAKGHFVAGDGKGLYYDWQGFIISDEKYILLDEIKEADPLWYERLIKDCIL